MGPPVGRFFPVVGNSSHAESGGDDASNYGTEIAHADSDLGQFFLEISLERELGLEWRAGTLFYLGVVGWSHEVA